MGWLEKVQKQFSIRMGDGKVYKPVYFNANRAVEYNLAEFEFRNLDGTLVDRRRRRGTVYNLELVFQGSDNIDVATAFQKSANNVNAWTISHPLYGPLVVQPISPVFHDNGNKSLNTTKIQVTVRETINAKALTNTVNSTDAILAKQNTVNAGLTDAMVTALPVPSVKVLSTMSNNVTLFQQALKNVSDVGAFLANGYNAAQTAINNVYSSINNVAGDLANAINTTQYLINLLANNEMAIFNKVAYINAELESLYAQAANLSLPPLPAFKQQWQDLKNTWCTTAGSCVSAMCGVSVFNIQTSDYAYSSQVNAVIAQIIQGYNNFLGYLDSMQTANGGELDSFIPDPSSLIALDDLVNLTLDTLYVIQANAKQPRVITLTVDNNVIQIAREIYGLLADDSTIAQIIQDNDICNDEIFQVAKGRQILYYA